MKLRQILTALASGLVLLAVLAGLPVLLLAVGGNPLPTGLPSLDRVGRVLTAPDDGRLVLGAAILTGCVCWALLLLASVAEAVDQLAAARGSARRPVRGAPGLGMPRSLMRPLVASFCPCWSASQGQPP